MSGVFSGNQWTTASGSTWRVVIEPDFVNQVSQGELHKRVYSLKRDIVDSGSRALQPPFISIKRYTRDVRKDRRAGSGCRGRQQ